GRSILLAVLAMYTAFATGPFVWVSTMSLRTTSEIAADPYALPDVWHWEKFPRAWFDSNYSVYFGNSVVVCAISVALLTVIGSLAAYALARYRFPGNRVI